MSRTTRDEEVRLNDQRFSYKAEYTSQLDVPQGIENPDNTLHWVHHDNIDKAIMNQASMVEHARIKGAKNLDPLKRQSREAEKYIVRRDLALMERPKHVTERIVEQTKHNIRSQTAKIKNIEPEFASRNNRNLINSF